MNKNYFLTSLLFTLSVLANTCEYIVLVECFIKQLDEWAMALYNSKSNIVTIVEGDGCQHYEEIRRCVEDDSPTKHNCNKSEIIEASRTVSDLLTHRKHSGTFLKSFYLLEYSCGVGKETVSENIECLNYERIGQETLAASTYMDNKLHEGLKGSDPYEIQMNPEDACEMLKSKLTQFKEVIGSTLCNGVAQSFMCKSLYDMFKNIYPATLGSCQYDCDSGSLLPPEGEPTVTTNQNAVEAGQTGLKPEAGGGKETPTNHCPPNILPNIFPALLCVAWLLVLLVNLDS